MVVLLNCVHVTEKTFHWFPISLLFKIVSLRSMTMPEFLVSPLTLTTNSFVEPLIYTPKTVFEFLKLFQGTSKIL